MEDLGHISLGQPAEPLRILQLTDLHHFPSGCKEFDVTSAKGRIVPLAAAGSAPDPGSYDPRRGLEVVESIIARTKPHLVVLTGDIVDGRPFGCVDPPDPHAWRGAFLDVLRPIVASGAAWTFTPGNHDDDKSPWSREALLGIYQLGEAAPGCISAGATSFNHTVTVGPAPPPAAGSLRLWLFDSGGNHLEDPTLKYHTFSPAAVDGYRSLSAALPRAECSLAYFHIPLPQCHGLSPIAGHQGLFDAALQSGNVPRPWRWEPFTSLVRLLGKDRVVGCSRLESGLFDALAERADVRACFFGHDHFSDAVFQSQGIYMIYGRVGASTPPSDWEGDGGPLPFQIGARMVEWSPDDGGGEKTSKLRTWVEVEAGREAGSEVTLEHSAVG